MHTLSEHHPSFVLGCGSAHCNCLHLGSGQTFPFVRPKHYISRRRLSVEILLFLWGGMAPSSFWLLVMKLVSFVVTFLPRKPSPSASNCCKFPRRNKQSFFDQLACTCFHVHQKSHLSCRIFIQLTEHHRKYDLYPCRQIFPSLLYAFSFAMASFAVISFVVTIVCAWLSREQSVTEFTQIINLFSDKYSMFDCARHYSQGAVPRSTAFVTSQVELS